MIWINFDFISKYLKFVLYLYYVAQPSKNSKWQNWVYMFLAYFSMNIEDGLKVEHDLDSLYIHLQN